MGHPNPMGRRCLHESMVLVESHVASASPGRERLRRFRREHGLTGNGAPVGVADFLIGILNVVYEIIQKKQGSFSSPSYILNNQDIFHCSPQYWK